MVVKLIAVDLDDTLVDGSGVMDPAGAEALKAAIKRGISVTIATGRMYRSAARYAEELGLDLPLITYNGALVKSTLSGKVFYYQPVDIGTCLDIVTYCATEHLHLNLYVDDHLYVKEYNDEVRYYENLGGVPAEIVGPLDVFINEYSKRAGSRFPGSIKVLIISDPEKVDKAERELSVSHGDKLRIMKSKPIFLELVNPKASKALALADLAKDNNIKASEIMAIGDSLNDLEMIEFAGYGVAVANARELVKAKADIVTDSPGGRGVAEAILSILNRM